ncbi:hypothetical protein ACJIZ3_008595 [Penstemon smallii]|uniref:Transmembrane protein n=1 Tax=Penstemon smallii TaxID=265156 RepID=A0ABD3TA77_9LAMI
MPNDKRILIVFLLVTSVPLFIQHPTTNDNQSLALNLDKQAFDYYSLVLTWPNSFCRLNKCNFSPIPNDFTIHGFWLDNVTQQLMFCRDKPAFNINIMLMHTIVSVIFPFFLKKKKKLWLLLLPFPNKSNLFQQVQVYIEDPVSVSYNTYWLPM